jgi:hypothetical protein
MKYMLLIGSVKRLTESYPGGFAHRVHRRSAFRRDASQAAGGASVGRSPPTPPASVLLYGVLFLLSPEVDGLALVADAEFE